MNTTKGLIFGIILYLVSSYIMYLFTHENKLLFLIYKFSYGILFYVILYYVYKNFERKYK